MNRRQSETCLAAAILALATFQGQPQQPGEQKPKPAAGAEKPKEAKPAPRQALPPVLPGFDLGKPRKEATVLAGTRGAGVAVPLALAPALGKTFGANPVFAWSYTGKAKTFVVVLRDEEQEVIFRKEVGGSNYRYPPDAPKLERNKSYYWTVAVHLVGDASSAPRGILVVSAATAKEIEEKLAEVSSLKPYEADLARARVLVDYRLWYDALVAYEDLIERYPDRAELYEDRGTVYAQLDVTKALAERDRARAAQLRRARQAQQ
jgi:hypothetical protein